MAVAATRKITITLTGDIVAEQIASVENTVSPGKRDIVTLASGANTITPPSGGTTPRGCTIIPPSSNSIAITLKGVDGDTGVLLHLTDPTSIALGNPAGTFVLSAAAEVAGVQLFWT